MDFSIVAAVVALIAFISGVLAAGLAANVGPLARTLGRSIGVRAFATGIAIVLISLGITTAIWFFYGSDEWSTYDKRVFYLIAIQTVGTVLGLAFAGGLGVYAIVEYMENHKSPKLLLLTNDANASNPLHELPKGAVLVELVGREQLSEKGLELWLINDSKVFADKYAIEIELPYPNDAWLGEAETLNEMMNQLLGVCDLQFGDEQQWSIAYRWHRSDDLLQNATGIVDRTRGLWLRFTSNQDTEVFPNSSMHLLTFRELEDTIDGVKTLPDSFQIRYLVWTKHADSVEDSINLQTVKMTVVEHGKIRMSPRQERQRIKRAPVSTDDSSSHLVTDAPAPDATEKSSLESTVPT